MKKKLILLLSIIMVLNISSCGFSAEIISDSYQVESESVSMDAEEKTTFAKEMDAVYEAAFANGQVKEGNRQEIDALMERATFTSGEERERTLQELALYGVYLHELSDSSQTKSDIGDVSMTAPALFYDAGEKTWTITCGGNWTNNNGFSGILAGDVGKEESFGVKYTNTSDTYRSCVVRAFAYITDEAGLEKASTENRSDGAGSVGFEFRLQDYTYNRMGTHGTQYVGYQWYGSCTYDSAFAAYSGTAAGYYTHTYPKAVTRQFSNESAAVPTDVKYNAQWVIDKMKQQESEEAGNGQ